MVTVYVIKYPFMMYSRGIINDLLALFLIEMLFTFMFSIISLPV